MTPETIMNIIQSAAFYNNMVHQKDLPQTVMYNDMDSWLKSLDKALLNINRSINTLIELNQLSGWDCVTHRDPGNGCYTRLEFSCLICRSSDLRPIAELIQTKFRNHLTNIEMTREFQLVIDFVPEYHTPNITELQQPFSRDNDIFLPIRDNRYT